MKEKMYFLAIRKRLHSNDYFWLHENYEFHKCEIDSCKGRYWFADPFLYECNGNTYLFYEAFDQIERRGKIAYSVLNNDGSWTKPKIILDECYHLSFPYIFENNENIYIMPEMSEDYSLKCYKAISFPDKWEIADVILPDVYACDSVFLQYRNQRFLLANEMYHNVPNGQYASCWVKNYLYKMDNMAVVGEGVKISEGDFGIRNAGRPFFIDGKLYRIGQDCRNRMYGRGIILFEIESLVPYIEKIVNIWNCDELSMHIEGDFNGKIVGSHTYNFSESYEIIDFSLFSSVSSYVIRERRKNRIYAILRRIKNVFI